MDDRTYSEPSEVSAEHGAVKMDGPDGVDVGLTPDAADETGDRLLQKAREARRQGRAQTGDDDPG